MAPPATSSSPSDKEGLAIPLIDLSPLLSDSQSARVSTGREILSAFEKSGFLYLKNYPISTSTLTTVFSHSAALFARPQGEKDSLAWTTPRANRGYVAHGREKVSEGRTVDEVARDRAGNGADLKESMEIGREGAPGFSNHWPDAMDEEGAEFKVVMVDFFEQCKDLHRVLMSAIALGMGYDERFFDAFVRKGDNTLRLLHYPPVSRALFGRNRGQVRAGAHTDYGSITLLFQDMRGGLQVLREDGNWEDVRPIEGTVVVNAGDLLARWSNERIRSTRHRVVEPPLGVEGEGVEGDGVEEYPARYSIAYFCNPDFDRTIEALPGTWEETGKKFEGINSGEYLVQRLTATYNL